MEVNPFDISHPTSLPLCNPLADTNSEEENDEDKEIKENEDDEMDLETSLQDRFDEKKTQPSRRKEEKKKEKSLPLTSAQELFLDNESNLLEEEMFFVQLPSLLPLQMKSSQTTSSGTLAASLLSNDGDNKLSQYESGLVGKLQIHRSGKISMKIGDNKFEVLPGTQTKFLQELALLDMQTKSYHSIGSLTKRLIVTPEI